MQSVFLSVCDDKYFNRKKFWLSYQHHTVVTRSHRPKLDSVTSGCSENKALSGVLILAGAQIWFPSIDKQVFSTPHMVPFQNGLGDYLKTSTAL